MGSSLYFRNKLDLDLKNRPIPPTKTPIEEPPIPVLKELHGHLRYTFLGDKNTLVIIVVELV